MGKPSTVKRLGPVPPGPDGPVPAPPAGPVPAPPSADIDVFMVITRRARGRGQGTGRPAHLAQRRGDRAHWRRSGLGLEGAETPTTGLRPGDRRVAAG